MTRSMTGGCLCRRIRYTATIRSEEAYFCHCSYCRRATGGVAAALTDVEQADIVWEREPDWYRSSPIAERPFCARCGTPLGFRFLEGSTKMDLTVGSFDDPGYFRPILNCAIESRIDAWAETRDLPGIRLDENPSTRDRWIAATGAVPE